MLEMHRTALSSFLCFLTLQKLLPISSFLPLAIFHMVDPPLVAPLYPAHLSALEIGYSSEVLCVAG